MILRVSLQATKLSRDLVKCDVTRGIYLLVNCQNVDLNRMGEQAYNGEASSEARPYTDAIRKLFGELEANRQSRKSTWANAALFDNALSQS